MSRGPFEQDDLRTLRAAPRHPLVTPEFEWQYFKGGLHGRAKDRLDFIQTVGKFAAAC